MAEEIDHCITHAHAHMNWKIKRFLDLPKEDNYCVTSPAFPLSHSKWFLLVYPNGRRQLVKESANWVGIYLKKDKTDEECYVAFRMGINTNNGSEWKYKIRGTFTMRNGEVKGYIFLIPRDSLLTNQEIFAADGSLEFFCSVRIVKTQEKESQTISPCVNQTLVEDMDRLYLGRQNADITIKMNDKYLEVHKCILAARSEVFAAMFSHDMAENKNGEVTIGDCDPDLFEIFLFFLYTGRFDNLASNNAINLFKIADMYEVKGLKDECVLCMLRKLSIDSFCDVKHLAVMHGEKYLRKSARKFFHTYKEQILKTPKWKTYTSENRNITKNLLASFYSKERRKRESASLQAKVKSLPNGG